MNAPVWLLPGFLGDESHFGTLPRALDAHAETIHWQNEVRSAASMQQAGEILAQRALASGTRPWLLGYSMGARLALQAALAAPGAFSGIVAVSAHPGYPSEDERVERRREDAEWAQLLLRDWEAFWTAWNRRTALAGGPLPVITVPDKAGRQTWAEVLVRLGTGQQDFFPALLSDPRLPPILCVAGKRDAVFVSRLSLFPERVKKAVIPGAGHRVPLEAPAALASLVASFIHDHQEVP